MIIPSAPESLVSRLGMNSVPTLFFGMDQNVFPYKTNACWKFWRPTSIFTSRTNFQSRKLRKQKHSLKDSIFIGLEYRQLIEKLLNAIMPGEQFNLGLLDDDDYKVSVLRTKMLGIGECFMYRLPKGSKSPYRYVATACATDRLKENSDVIFVHFNKNFSTQISFHFGLPNCSFESISHYPTEPKVGHWRNPFSAYRFE